MRVYIAGGAGMLGEGFLHVFLEAGHSVRVTDINLPVNHPYRNMLSFDFGFINMNNRREYLEDVFSYHPDILIHMGAITDLEYAENNPSDTFTTNGESVRNAVSAAMVLGIPVMYISTAGIFHGNKKGYVETDTPFPINMYGLGKYIGERNLEYGFGNSITMRAGWMMGGGPALDKKFIRKMWDQRHAPSWHVVDDKMGTPTYTRDFAKVALELILRGERGIFHCSCQGFTSRLEVATELARLIGYTGSIIPVSSNFYAKEYFVKRPYHEELINARLDTLGLNTMRPWQEALKEYVEEWYCGV